MNIKTNIANSANYGGQRNNIEYIVIHYTANDGDTAEANANYFKNNVVKSSANYFCDDNDIVQSVPDNRIPYSVGGKKYKNTKGGSFYGKCTNSNSLNIELCDTVKDGKSNFSEATLNNAIELVKAKMKEYNISIEKVIRHYDVTGKVCPKPFVENEQAWNDFKNRLISNEKSKTEEKSLDDILFDAYLYYSLYEDLQKAFGNDYNKLKEHWLTNGINEGRRGSYVFDVHYYFAAYEDLRKNIGANCMELYNHFKTFGIKEGRKGCNEFEVGAYAYYNEDLKNAYGADYLQHIKHFLSNGINEIRKTSGTFSVEVYKNSYEDLQKAFGNNIKDYYKHYIMYGAKEGRKTI